MAKKAKKLPKTIAGVRLSKPVRKAGGRLLEAAGSPRGRELIATGLAMVVAAAASSRTEAAGAAPRAEAEVPPAKPPLGQALEGIAASFVSGLAGRKA